MATEPEAPKKTMEERRQAMINANSYTGLSGDSNFSTSLKKMVERPRSPRSERLLQHFKSKGRKDSLLGDMSETELGKLDNFLDTKSGVAETLHLSKSVMAMTGALCVEFMKDESTEALEKHISHCFATYDANGNGLLEVDEIQNTLKLVGKPCSTEDAEEFLKEHGAGKDGLTLQDFSRLVHQQLGR